MAIIDLNTTLSLQYRRACEHICLNKCICLIYNHDHTHIQPTNTAAKCKGVPSSFTAEMYSVTAQEPSSLEPRWWFLLEAEEEPIRPPIAFGGCRQPLDAAPQRLPPSCHHLPRCHSASLLSERERNHWRMDPSGAPAHPGRWHRQIPDSLRRQSSWCQRWSLSEVAGVGT